MDHEQHVREPRAEVSSVRVVVPTRLGSVDVTAFGAVQLHLRAQQGVCQLTLPHSS